MRCWEGVWAVDVPPPSIDVQGPLVHLFSSVQVVIGPVVGREENRRVSLLDLPFYGGSAGTYSWVSSRPGRRQPCD